MCEKIKSPSITPSKAPTFTLPKAKKEARTNSLPPDLESIRYLNEFQVSELTGRAVQTLRNERFRGTGIPYSKLRRSVLYALPDVLAFMASRRIQTKEEG